MESLDVIKLIEKISSRWLIHALLMIIGGLSGLLFSYHNKPVYEATATFAVTIDYTQTGALTDIQEDQAMRGVGSVILSDRVISQTLAQSENDGTFNINYNDFLKNSFLDRQEFKWVLRYQDDNFEKAEFAVSKWANAADAIIQEGLRHALTSSALIENLNEMKLCLQDSSSIEIPDSCGFKDSDALMSSMDEISTLIQAEKIDSLGLLNALSVSLVNLEQSNPSPIYGQRNLLVIGGALIGLIASVAIIAANEIRRSLTI